MNETQHLIKTATLQSILNYMATRPYNEVFQLVKDIQESKPYECVEENEKDTSCDQEG